MTCEKETDILLRAAERLRKLGFVILATVIEGIANEQLTN